MDIEFKVEFMMCQKSLKGVPPVEIVSAQIQTNNKSSGFKNDTVLSATYAVENFITRIS